MKKLITAPLTAALTAALFTVPAYAEETPACTNPGYQVTSGTLDWGIKQTFRSYIKGSIAHGTWKSSGVAEVGDVSISKDFYFEFPVDPEKSKIFLDESGKIDSAQVETKDSNITFEGHDGALYTEMISPYVTVKGSKTEVGTTYVGYYVEGKAMQNYDKTDRTPANRKEGKDTFTVGDLQTPKVTRKGDSDSYTIEFSSTGMKYVPKPGTRVEQRKGRPYQFVEGVDVLFLGFYEKGKDFDDYTVSLEAKKTCLDSEEDQDLKDDLDNTAPPEITTEVPAQEEQEPKKDTSGSSKDTDFGEIRDGWSIFLAVAGVISMFAILSKLLEDIIKPFLPKF